MEGSKHILWLGWQENWQYLTSWEQLPALLYKRHSGGLSWNVNMFFWGLNVSPVTWKPGIWTRFVTPCSFPLLPLIKKEESWKNIWLSLIWEIQRRLKVSDGSLLCTVALRLRRAAINLVNCGFKPKMRSLNQKTCCLTVLEWEQNLCSSSLKNINI